MILLLLFLIPLSSSRHHHLILDENDQLRMPGFENDALPSLMDRKPVEDMLDVSKTKWTEDQMKMYYRGLEDNTTVVTFSMKVYYTIEVDFRDFYFHNRSRLSLLSLDNRVRLP